MEQRATQFYAILLNISAIYSRIRSFCLVFGKWPTTNFCWSERPSDDREPQSMPKIQSCRALFFFFRASFFVVSFVSIFISFLSFGAGATPGGCVQVRYIAIGVKLECHTKTLPSAVESLLSTASRCSTRHRGCERCPSSPLPASDSRRLGRSPFASAMQRLQCCALCICDSLIDSLQTAGCAHTIFRIHISKSFNFLHFCQHRANYNIIIIICACRLYRNRTRKKCPVAGRRARTSRRAEDARTRSKWRKCEIV